MESPRTRANVCLRERMRETHEDSLGMIGTRLMQGDLTDEDELIRLNRVVRQMVCVGLQG